MERLAPCIIFILAFYPKLYAQDLFTYASKDPESRISKTFTIPKYFNHSVEFWFNIYTKYDSKYSVIHDSKNLKLVYKVVKRTKKKATTKSIKKELRRLSKSLTPSKLGKNIIKLLQGSNIKIPKSKKSRKHFYRKLRKSIRAQTGQRDMITKGLTNIQIFKPVISSLFHEFALPNELLAIPFLESSFNLKAKSKVGATGVWQFMSRVGKHFMTINKYVDDRNNPVIASVSALHLLKQNLQVLKRWDLAIPAYNSGTKHLLRAKRSLKSKVPNLQNILTDYKHSHMGFASKNFYSEFLALVHALAYREKTFPIIKDNQMKKIININNIKIYLAKCSISPMKLFAKLRKKSSQLKFLNSHIKKKSFKRYVPRGTIFISDIKLNTKLFQLISTRNARRIFPRYWKKLIKRKKCI